MEPDRTYKGDAWELAGQLDDESVDCIVTSPPYWGLRDYGVEGQLGLESHPQEWVDMMIGLMERLRPKLKKTGTARVNIGETYYTKSGGKFENDNLMPKERVELLGINRIQHLREKHSSPWLQPKQMLGLPWRFAIAMQDKGWILRNDIVWWKPNHMPSSVRDRFASSHEHVFLFAKSRKYFFDLNAVREPHQSGPAKFNIRIRDAQKGIHDKAVYWGEASAKEIDSYDEKAMSQSARTTKIPASLAESMNSPRARYHRTKQQEHSNRQVSGFNERYKSHLFGNKSHGGEKINLKNQQPFNINGKNPGDVWRITTRPHPFAHFAVFPEELAERCIRAGCPTRGLVLDPFMGAGTVAVVARRFQRQYIGFELNEEYIKIAELRLKGFGSWQECGKNRVLGWFGG